MQSTEEGCSASCDLPANSGCHLPAPDTLLAFGRSADLACTVDEGQCTFQARVGGNPFDPTAEYSPLRIPVMVALLARKVCALLSLAVPVVPALLRVPSSAVASRVTRIPKAIQRYLGAM